MNNSPRFFLFVKNPGLNRQWIKRIILSLSFILYKAIPVRDWLPRAHSLRLMFTARSSYVHAEVTSLFVLISSFGGSIYVAASSNPRVESG